jgi:hypothetical protein
VIRVTVVLEPDGFEDERERGEAHMRAHPTRKPIDIWSQFRSHLARGFEHRCGYTAMRTFDGQVDHYRCQKDYRHLTYEWSNYSYCSSAINCRKGSRDVLDPYEVENRWFEILYPSLQMVLTGAVPAHERERAGRTLACLGLCNDEFIIRQRAEWLEMYERGELSLVGLRRVAPLLADMVERHDVRPRSAQRPTTK